MAIVATKEERDKGEEIIKLLSDMSVDAALSAISYARGKIDWYVTELTSATKLGAIIDQDRDSP
jgi:hypothetical protein